MERGPSRLANVPALTSVKFFADTHFGEELGSLGFHWLLHDCACYSRSLTLTSYNGETHLSPD